MIDHDKNDKLRLSPVLALTFGAGARRSSVSMPSALPNLVPPPEPALPREFRRGH